MVVNGRGSPPVSVDDENGEIFLGICIDYPQNALNRNIEL